MSRNQLPIVGPGEVLQAEHYAGPTRFANEFLQQIRGGISRRDQPGHIVVGLPAGAPFVTELAVDDRISSTGPRWSTQIHSAWMLRVAYDDTLQQEVWDERFGPDLSPTGSNGVQVFFPLIPAWLDAGVALDEWLGVGRFTAFWSRDRNRWESDFVPPLTLELEAVLECEDPSYDQTPGGEFGPWPASHGGGAVWRDFKVLRTPIPGEISPHPYVRDAGLNDVVISALYLGAFGVQPTGYVGFQNCNGTWIAVPHQLAPRVTEVLTDVRIVSQVVPGGTEFTLQKDLAQVLLFDPDAMCFPLNAEETLQVVQWVDTIPLCGCALCSTSIEPCCADVTFTNWQSGACCWCNFINGTWRLRHADPPTGCTYYGDVCPIEGDQGVCALSYVRLVRESYPGGWRLRLYGHDSMGGTLFEFVGAPVAGTDCTNLGPFSLSLVSATIACTTGTVSVSLINAEEGAMATLCPTVSDGCGGGQYNPDLTDQCCGCGDIPRFVEVTIPDAWIWTGVPADCPEGGFDETWCARASGTFLLELRVITPPPGLPGVNIYWWEYDFDQTGCDTGPTTCCPQRLVVWTNCTTPSREIYLTIVGNAHDAQFFADALPNNCVFSNFPLDQFSSLGSPCQYDWFTGGWPTVTAVP